MIGNVLYLGNSANKALCRDAEQKYCESLGIKFMDLRKALNNEMYRHLGVQVIDGGWKTEEYLQCIDKYLERSVGYGHRVYIRLVDDNVDRYTSLDCEVYRILSTYKDHIGLIAPYKHAYYGKFHPYIIPYHVGDIIEGTHERDIVFSGFDLPIYKLRHELYQRCDINERVDIPTHPGYSGRAWNKTRIGDDFIRLLSDYKVMIVTSYDSWELLKYAECAEAGCCPVGEFPESLYYMMPESLRSLHCTNAEQVLKVADEIIKHGTWRSYAKEYREFMLTNRSKELITSLWNNL